MNTGKLHVSAHWRAGCLARLETRLDRPQLAPLLEGQSAAQVGLCVPLFYSLCRHAQGLAAGAALAAAAGRPAPPPAHSVLWQETLHEHLWRLLLDWPAALDLAAAPDAFAVWRKLRTAPIPALLSATAALFDTVLGVTPSGQVRPAGLAARCLAALGSAPALAPVGLDLPDPEAWLARQADASPMVAADPLAELDAIATPASPGVAYAQQLANAHAAWQALAAGHPYPLRLAAWPHTRRGLAFTHTARGWLAHEVVLTPAARVSRYRIWAPTDRRFASAAGLARQLAALPALDAATLRRQLELAILALDPCLPWQIDWTED